MTGKEAPMTPSASKVGMSNSWINQANTMASKQQNLYKDAGKEMMQSFDNSSQRVLEQNMQFQN